MFLALVVMDGSPRPRCGAWEASSTDTAWGGSRRRIHSSWLVAACAVAVLAWGCSQDQEDSSRSSPPLPVRSGQDRATATVPAPPSAGAADDATTGELRARLTPEYLAGEWCAVFSQERSRYVFGPDGSFRLALPGADFRPGGTVDDLLEDFRVVREVEADRFVLSRGERGHREYVFRRGPC